MMQQFWDTIAKWWVGLSGLERVMLIASCVAGLGAIWVIFFGQRNIVDFLFKLNAKLKRAILRVLGGREFEDNIITNLPSRYRWISREAELEEAIEKVRANSLLVIEGPRGCGKTTIAVELAHTLYSEDFSKSPEERSFEAYVWISAKHRDFTFGSFLDAVALSLDYPVISQTELDNKQPLLLKLLGDRQILLCVDNFETVQLDAEKISTFLTSMPQSCKVVVTTSQPVTWLHGQASLRLEGMEREESVALIRQESVRQGLHVVSALSQDRLESLHETTGGLPLAIEWAIGQIRNGQAYDATIEQLLNARGDIFQELFGVSWSILCQDARNLIMALTAFKEPVTRELLIRVSGLSISDFDEALGQLAGLCLIVFSEDPDEYRRRYSLHPLTHTYVHRKAEADDGFLKEVCKRAAPYYIEFARQRHEVKVSGIKAREVEEELQNIFGIIDLCLVCRQRKAAVDLVEAIEDLLFILGMFEERIHYSQLAADSSKSLKDFGRQAHFLTVISGTLILKSQYEEAEQHSQMALEAADKARNVSEKARALRTLASSRYRQQDYERAEEMIEGIDEMALNAKDIPACIDILFLKANLHFMQKKLDIAQNDCKRMLDFCDKIEWQRAKAYAYGQMGDILVLKKNTGEAEEQYSKGILIAAEYNDRRQIARLQLSQGKLAAYKGRARTARLLLHSASDVFLRLGMVNEFGEANKALKFVGSWPCYIWFFLRLLRRPPLQYTELPLGGD